MPRAEQGSAAEKASLVAPSIQVSIGGPAGTPQHALLELWRARRLPANKIGAGGAAD